MPSMYVNVPRLEQETKNTLVAKLLSLIHI